MISLKNRLLTVLSATALACSIAPLAAGAQVPSYSQAGPETIQGTIVSINGKYNISVNDARGYVDNVSLHDGTIINPTGLTLAPGEPVTITGTPSGSTFVADQINTPYRSYAYAYPAYPAYPVYPAVGIGIRLGGPGWGFRGRF